MSLKLYTDKSEVFECNVSLQGASIKESKLRAILKFDDKNLMVEGKINSNGKGEILFPKLKNISEDGDVGTMELEVIAEDAYFQPYEETFSVVTSKKATVEVLSKKPSKPKIVVEKIKKRTPAQELINLFRHFFCGRIVHFLWQCNIFHNTKFINSRGSHCLTHETARRT